MPEPPPRPPPDSITESDADEPERRKLSRWKQIASFLDVSIPSARREWHQRGLPVYEEGKRRYYAYTDEIDDWKRQREAEQRAAVEGPEGSELPPDADLPPEAEPPPEASSSSDGRELPRRAFWPWILAAAGIAISTERGGAPQVGQPPKSVGPHPSRSALCVSQLACSRRGAP